MSFHRSGSAASGGVLMAETRFRYQEPKSNSNFGIGIGADIYFRNQSFQFSNMSHVSYFFLGDFKSLKITPRSSKIIGKYLKFGSKFRFKVPFVMEKIPHTISNYYLDSPFEMLFWYLLWYWPKSIGQFWFWF